MVLKMIIKHQLREVYAVVWVFVVLLIPVFIVFYPLFLKFSHLIGVETPLSTAFLIGFSIAFYLLLHFSVINSNTQRTLKNSVQKVAVLETHIRELEKKLDQLRTGTKP